jgi:trimeric autotransporter adhesin
VDKFAFDKDGNLVLMEGDLNLTKGKIMFSDATTQDAAAPVTITAGTGLSGGGKADAAGNVTLTLDTAFTDARYLKLTGGTLTGELKGTTADFAASSTDDAVSASSDSGDGVDGTSDSGFGVFGDSTSNVGVAGESTDREGVLGTSSTKGGVVGMSSSGDGVAGVAVSGPAGVFGSGKVAGAFSGNVGVTGTLSVTGLKSFHIDHPLDPANKYLNHFAMESNEVLDTYSGNVTTDLSGTATVMLPTYFSALNVNYRYQLTVIGQFAQAIIFREIENNTFVIKTDKPSVKVSWQVTGVRHDAWVRNHPPQVEEAKPPRERGYYLHPEFFGQPEEKSVMWLYHGATIRDAKALWLREAAKSR